jgi:hypothetical protein
MRKYYHQCSKCGATLTPKNWYEFYQKIHRQICKSCEQLKAKERYHRNPRIWIQRSQVYYSLHKKEIREHQNKENAERRIRVLMHYGGMPPRCDCCGEQHLDFLTIDHMKGGGCKHRKLICGSDSSTSFYRWLEKKRFPKGFRVLCSNCNLAIGKRGICPHKKEVE